MDFAIYFSAFLMAYITGIIVYIALVWVVTREGRGLLMQGDRMNVVFYSQLSACWAFTAIAAGAVAMRICKGGSMGETVAGLAGAALAIAVLRNHSKAKHEQPMRVSLLLLLCIAAGTAAACVLTPPPATAPPGAAATP